MAGPKKTAPKRTRAKTKPRANAKPKPTLSSLERRAKRTAKPKRKPRKKAPQQRKKPISRTTLEGLARIWVSQENAAAILGVSLSTLKQRMNDDPELRELWDRGRAEGAAGIHQAQYALAVGTDNRPPNATMLIWLGKQHLGQKDQVEQTHKGRIVYEDAHAELFNRLAARLTQGRTDRRGVEDREDGDREILH